VKNTILIYCILSFLISWTAKFFYCAEDLGWIGILIPKGILQLVASYGPSLAGIIIYYLEHRQRGLIALTKSLSRINIRIKWYLVALFFELGSFILIVAIAHFTGYRNTPLLPGELGNSFASFFINTITLALLTGLGEEIGWRGFLLPKLQSGFPVIQAAVILALINSLWHLRTDLLALLMQGELKGFVLGYLPDMGQRILISVPVVFIMVYLFNSTRGSLFIMVLFHGSANASWEWVKQVTGLSEPSYLLPSWTVFLWFTTLYFIPALQRQMKDKKLVTSLL
jgi:membrane protease YdiL (CAAX protease family)